MLNIFNLGINILIEILIDIVIFYFIYSAMDRDVRYLENVLIYAVCMEIKLMIVTGYISIIMFFLLFGGYFVIGLIMIFILSKLYNHFDRIPFIVISILVQFGVSLLLNWVLILFIQIFY